MKVEGTHQLNASRARVYELLVDPEVLQRCIPGCERLEKTDADTYSATIRAGVGAIKGVFTGTVRLEDMRPPEHHRIVVAGKGGPGFLKGSGDLDLEEQGDGMLISYTGDLQLGGTSASVGQRMIQGTAKMMACRNFYALKQKPKVKRANRHLSTVFSHPPEVVLRLRGDGARPPKEQDRDTECGELRNRATLEQSVQFSERSHTQSPRLGKHAVPGKQRAFQIDAGVLIVVFG